MMATIAMTQVFRPLYDGLITADVYANGRAIARPGDEAEIGDEQQGCYTIAEIGGELYWVENSAWTVRDAAR